MNSLAPLIDKLGRWKWRIPPEVAIKVTDIQREALEEMWESREKFEEYVRSPKSRVVR